MKWTYIPATVLVIVGVCLFGSVVYVFVDRGVQPKELVSLVPALLSFLGSVAVAVLAANTTKQAEELKTKLGQQSKAIEAAVAAVVPKRHEGYHEMWRAASEYFRALQSLEEGIYDEAALKSAETSCLVDIGKSLLSPAKDEELFRTFWQNSVTIKDNARIEMEKVLNPHGLTHPEAITDPQHKTEQDKRIERVLNEYWQRVGKQYGYELTRFREDLQKRLEAAIPKISEDNAS